MCVKGGEYMTVPNIQEYIIPIVMLACLVVGYVLKTWMPTDNKWIPTTLTIVGAVLGCVAMKDITLTAIVEGAISGLASTGLHQAFKQIIEGSEVKGNE